MVKSYHNISLFCLSFLIIFCFSIFGLGSCLFNCPSGSDAPGLKELNKKQEALASCNVAHTTAITQACNEKTYSRVTKKVIEAFQISQQIGDIKKACEKAGELNRIAGAINFRTSKACNDALSQCVQTCGESKVQLESLNLTPPDPTMPEKIAEVNTKIKECTSKQKGNYLSYGKQALATAKSFLSSKQCSDQVTDDLTDPGKDLLSLTDGNNNNNSDFNPQHQQNQAPGQNSNLLRNNKQQQGQNQAFFEACTEKPSGIGCQELLCESMPDKNTRHVCREDGFEFMCEQIPGLPQCKYVTANNLFDCKSLPLPLQRECESEGAIAFCQKHSQLTKCQKILKGDFSDSQKSLASASGSARGSAGGSGSGGSFGGGSSSAGDGSFGSGSSDGSLESRERDIDADIASHLSALEEIKSRSFQGSPNYGASGGRRSYGTYDGKFKGLDFKKLLAQSKSKGLKKALDQFHTPSSQISSANGLTNFQKVSRIYQSYRHKGKLKGFEPQRSLTKTPEQQRALANFNAPPRAGRTNNLTDF